MGTDDFGKRMNSIPKYVVSATLADADATWGPTTVIRGDAAAEIAKLRAEPGGDLLVEGSSQLVHTLVQHHLVDEYRIMVFPIILGGGKRMFPDSMPDPASLTLERGEDGGHRRPAAHPAPRPGRGTRRRLSPAGRRGEPR